VARARAVKWRGMVSSPLPRHPLLRLIGRTLLGAAAFAYSLTFFLIVIRHLELPPTPAVGIGRVTLDGASKLNDYLGAALFFLISVAGTLLFSRGFERLLGAFNRRRYPATLQGDRTALVVIAVFALSFFLSPLIFLTSRKEGLALLIPLALAASFALALDLFRRRIWLRTLFAERFRPFHAALFGAGVCWIFFRYLVTGRRIAHHPTLILEIVFVLFFLALTFATAIFITRLLVLLAGWSQERALAVVALTSLPLLTLPLFGLMLVSERTIILGVIASMAVVAIALSRTKQPERFAAPLGRSIAWLFWPFFIFCFSFASTAALSSWIDLFHRGETLGPASDYLRGKTPYLDVFVLHGMLENGLLDAWLMGWLGRDAAVATARAVIAGSLTFPAVYLIGLLLFRSVPLSLLTVAVSLFTFVDNQRVVVHLVAVALLLAAIRTGRRGAYLASGAVAGFGIFYSLDIGLYAVATALVAIPLIGWLQRSGRVAIEGFRTGTAMIFWTAGLLAGVAPFAVWLAWRGALGGFFVTSFVTVPSVIDAVWSLPFPNFVTMFRGDLSLRTISDFILGERIRFILNPLLISFALIVLTRRFIQRRGEAVDALFLTVVIAALVAQRSALGRADFQHQYFAAYLIGVIVVMLGLRAWQKSEVSAPTGSSTAFRSLAAAVVLLAGGVVLWVPDLLTARLDSTILYRPRISGVGYTDAAGAAVQKQIALFSRTVREATRRDDPIFDFSNQPALYFYSGRPNPTRFYQIPIASPMEFQMEIIEALETSRTPLVVRNSPLGYDRFDGIPNERRAAALARYLDEQYEPWRTVGGIDLWKRRAAAADLRRYTSVEAPGVSLLADEQLIFPTVASAPGAAGAVWRSDLLLQNPFDEELVLRLRYSTPSGSSERTLALAPRSGVELEDVAARFFRRPGTGGVLRLRYPLHRRPVAVLTSYDTSRESSRIATTPLSSHAAAHAGTPARFLTLTGLAGSPVRRVNLGVVNTGAGAAHFRIVARLTDGSIIGLPVVSALHEGESFTLVNAAVPLGTPIEQSMSIQIELREGSALGWGSVIDGATGAHYLVPALAGAGW
jgi:hypothetical protein